MKYIITGLHSSGKQEVIDILEKLEVKCGRLFSNIDKASPTLYNSFNYELYTDSDISEIFENNAYVFIKDVQQDDTVGTFYEGLSKYAFDNNDVFVLSPDEIISIPNTFPSDDICIIWMDGTLNIRTNRYLYEKRSYNFAKREKFERREIQSFVKKLYDFNPKHQHLLYFSDEEPSRVATIIYTLLKFPELLPIYEKNFN